MEHAKLSPSGAALDLKCPGNRREQAKIPRSSNEYSAKGTGLHAVGANCLTREEDANMYIGFWCGETPAGADFLMKAEPQSEKGLWKFKVTPEDAANVQIYVSHVREQHIQATGSELLIEKKVEINENCWGTADAQIIQPFGLLHIEDYKNGRTYVDANTPQLKLYAVGAMGVTNPLEIQQIVCTIVQPNAPSAEAIRSIAYTPKELLSWFHGAYEPAAAKCLEPDAPLFAGSWCKDHWCNARATCSALSSLANEIAQDMFAVVEADRPNTLPAPIMLTAEQRQRVLTYMDVVKDWMNKVYDYEYARALHGDNDWGKLVAGQKSRSWIDEQIAEEKLNYMLAGEAHDRTLKSPAKAEAALKERGFKPKETEQKLAGMISSKDGKPKLVHVDAKGKPVSVIDGMFEEV
jgi:hypothetical protein